MPQRPSNSWKTNIKLPNQRVNASTESRLNANTETPVHPTTSSTSTQQQQHESSPTNHFFRLPAELRNRIYNLVLLPNSCRNTTCLQPKRHFCPTNPEKFAIPPLLRASRKLRAESAAIYYANTTFLFHGCIGKLAECLKLIDPEHLKHIRRVKSNLSLNGKQDAIDWLKWARKELKGKGLGLRKDALETVFWDGQAKKEKTICLGRKGQSAKQ